MNFAGDVSRCGRGVAIAVRDCDVCENCVRLERNLIVRIETVQVVLQRQILNHGNLAGHWIDRESERSLTAVGAVSIDAAHDQRVAVNNFRVKADCRSVSQLHARSHAVLAIPAIECQRKDSCARRRLPVHAEIGNYDQRGRAAGRERKRIPPVVRIVADIGDVLEHRQRASDVIALIAGRFISSDAKTGLHGHCNGRTIVFKPDVTRNVGGSGSLVAVTVGDCDRCLHTPKRVAERDVFVGIDSDICAVVMQRNVLNQRNDAGHRINVECECCGIGACDLAISRIITANDEITFLEQEDFMMIRCFDL